MVRILPMASSSLHLVSLRPSLSSFRFSAITTTTTAITARFGVSVTAYNPSRRLALFHLGSESYSDPIVWPPTPKGYELTCFLKLDYKGRVPKSTYTDDKSYAWPMWETFAIAIPQTQLFNVKESKLLRTEGNGIEAGTPGNIAQASTAFSQENDLEWVKKDKRRMLHVVYRVGDLDKTIKFYTECLGMKLLRKRDIPEERYTNAFLGYGPEDSQFVVELTYNYGVDKYDIGSGFGHFGIAVEDVVKTVDLVKAKGGKVTREPGPVKGGSTVIAFVEDPDGYKFELLERGPTPEPLCQVMLRVGDLDRAINFYEKAFGMELLRKRDNPEYKYTIAMMGYGPEDKNTVLELTYNYGVTEYNKGNAYAQIAIGTDDVYKTAEIIKKHGGKITREPGPLPGLSTKITACLDPDGWKSVFVDNIDFLKELE